MVAAFETRARKLFAPIPPASTQAEQSIGRPVAG